MVKLSEKSIIVTILAIFTLLTLTACSLDILGGHKHALEHTAETNSTCILQGNGEYWYCTDCKKYFADANAKIEISFASTKKSLIHHDFGDWSVKKDATESEEGLKIRTCTVCGQEESQKIDKLPHTHTTTRVEATDSTCKKQGNVEYWVCSVCGDLFFEQSATNQVTLEGVKKPLAAHSYGEWTVEKDATETEEGLKIRTCSVCNDVDELPIAKLPHTHKYASVWTYDTIAHWHAATCCADAPNKDYAVHNLNGENKCTICGYDASAINIVTLSKGSYGYSTLNEKEKAFYDKIDEVIAKFHDEGNATVQSTGTNTYNTLQSINFDESGLTKDNALNVYKIYKADHPLYYWLGTTTLFNDKSIFPVVVDDYATEKARKDTNKLLYEKIYEYYYLAKASDNDYQKALCYHDAIIDAIDYAYDSKGYPSSEEWAHNVLGVFLNGKDGITGAVCEGYAKAFQLLLNLAKIENLTVSGVGVTASGSEGHLWNMVKLGKVYYYFDLTWDDQPLNGRGRIYDYFCATESDVATSHYPNVSLSQSGLVSDKLYDLPSNAATTDYDGLDTVYSTFISDDCNYVICGYDEVQLIECTKTGIVDLPNAVTYNSRNYDLVSIGTIYGDVTTLKPVFANFTTDVTIPKTVDFIWDFAFRCSSIKTIKVDNDNKRFSDDKGVLYTKSKYTLIYFPAKNENSVYTVSDNCRVIALNAFEYGNVTSLTLPKTVTEFYIPNYGVGYADNDAEYQLRLPKITAQCNAMKGDTKLTYEEFVTKTKIKNVNRLEG